jgi:uncharacterized protein
MTNPPSIATLEPTSDEKTMAIFAHVFQLFGGWIAPLIIFLVKRQSRFVSFHALQALLLQIVHLVVVFVFMMVWFAAIFGTLFSSMAHSQPGRVEPPVGLFVVFPLFWLVLMADWIAILLVAIIYGIKASRGEWAEYPVIGMWARKILKIGPGGTAYTA